MFYLVQHIWFFLLLAAALGAFLMWLLREWSKEETANDLIIGWEARLDALRNENSQMKAQLQGAASKTSVSADLQADLNRQEQQGELTEAGSKRDHTEAVWMKKYGDLEADYREKMTALEIQLAKLRTEFSALSNDRDSLEIRLKESVRTAVGVEQEGDVVKDQAHQVQEELRRELASARQELASLTADSDKSQKIETEWREKWHEADAIRGRVQTELAALKAGQQHLAAIESEKSRWQAEASALAGRIAALEAESIQAQSRLAEIVSENERLRDVLRAPAAAPEVYEELRKRLAAAEQETANLKSHLSTASFLQDEWRNKWHDAEARCAAAQQQLAELSKSIESRPNLDSENARLQSELANLAAKYTLLRAESDLHISKVKELSDRLAQLDPTPRNPS